MKDFIYTIYSKTGSLLSEADSFSSLLIKLKIKKQNHIGCITLLKQLNDKQPITGEFLGNCGARKKQLELLDPIGQAIESIVYKNTRPIDELNKARQALNKHSRFYPNSWLYRVEEICIGGGLFLFAYEIRDFTNKRLINKYEKRKIIRIKDVIKLIWAYLAKAMYKEIGEITGRLNLISKLFLRKSIIRLFDSIGINYNNKSGLFPMNASRSAYGGIITNKKVAVLGPSAGDFDAKEVNAEFDIKVRMNFIGDEKLDPARRVAKTDVSYYNFLTARKLTENEINLEFLDTLEFAVFKKMPSPLKATLSEEKRMHNIRLMDNIHGLSFNKAGPNLLQALLVDLLRFSPEKVKVYNVNLYLSKNRYQKGYKIEGTFQDKMSFWRSFSQHNMMSMFEFMRVMYKHGVIQMDDEGKTVLNLSLENYVFKMQELEWSDFLKENESE